MCGIAGFLGNFSETLLYEMNRMMRHRGPDDAGSFFDGVAAIGLAHRRLSIIDLTTSGHQPMWDSKKLAAIIFNGEIFNYRELRAGLVADGFHFSSASDTEVILNLYLRDGERCLAELNGMFTIAIWDTRDGSLFLARDGIGVKPLYYCETAKGFLFASELKALFAEPSVSRELNFLALHNYLQFLWCPAPDTPLQHIIKLEPGHAMIVQDGRIRKKWRFYDLPYGQEIQQVPEAQTIEMVREQIKKSVERQMVADVEVGAFLSGGLDSSSVVAFAREYAHDRKLQCFTIGFKDDSWRCEGMIEDLGYAQQVARHLDVDLHTISVGPEMVDQLQAMIYHLDEPQADPAPINALLICKLAREHGIKVLLSGAGGDDIFTGYRRHHALLLEKYWEWLPQTARMQLSRLTQMLPKSTPMGRRLAKAFQYAGLDGEARIASYFNWNTPEYIRGLLSKDVLQSIDREKRTDPLLNTLKHLPRNTHPLNKMLYLEGKHFLADHNLNYTDKMSMAYGVEVRVPLLDPDLVALAARLPVHGKQNGREGKWIFKKAMEPYLPHNVIYRPKTGFGAPLRSWLRNELRPLAEDVLSEKSLLNRGLFAPQAVKQLLIDDRQGRVDGTYTIFSLMCIELWCRIFLDKKIPSC